MDDTRLGPLESTPADTPTSITFMLTDIEGSTRMWDEDSATAKTVVERHDALVEDQVRRFEGEVIRPRGEGDSRFVVFSNPVDAISAAAHIQLGLAAEPWPLQTPLRVRIALHTGAAEFRQGDYYGSDVNRCARIRSLARGGQTLVSLATRELVGDRLAEGFIFRDLGSYRLRGLAATEQVFQLVIPGIENDFPPLKVSDPLTDTQALEQEIRFCMAPDGVNLAYATVGAGPPIVKAANWLNHLEFDWQSPIWRHWIEGLSEYHRLIRYDERGSGLSDWNAEDLSFASWVQDLETVVEAADLDRFVLLGISQGGAVSVAYTVQHPEKVSLLILYGSYVKGWRKRSKPDEIRAREAMITLTETGWGAGNPAYRQIFTTRFMPQASSEQMHWFNDLQKNTTSPENAVVLQQVTADIDIEDLAARVRVPTLVLHARQDGSVPFDQGRKLASLIPGARFVSLESPNHILLEDEPAWEQFLKEVRRFLGVLSV
jgi:class 3 adenylate cyclase/pimeloyl-ACP methyl ester carboxylesterase